MSREQLRKAAAKLEDAREHTDDAETDEQLAEYADRLRNMADAEDGPDHGGLARITHNVRELEGDLEASEIEQIVAHVNAYRETVEGV